MCCQVTSCASRYPSLRKTMPMTGAEGEAEMAEQRMPGPEILRLPAENPSDTETQTGMNT